MMINGVDYTLPLVAVASFFFTLVLQLLLRKRVRNRFVRLLPWFWVILVLVCAVLVLFSDPGDSFLDLRGAVSLLLIGYAAICAAGIRAADLVHKLQKR